MKHLAMHVLCLLITENVANIRVVQDRVLSYPPPPLVVPHPLSFPGGGGGWGTVTWSTQNFSLRLIVLLCG